MTNQLQRWIVLDGAANVRDLGGLPTTDGGVTRFGQVFRADNLQGLTEGDVTRLIGELNLRQVVDLRSNAEVSLEGPGPLTRVPEVSVHHLTLFAEGGVHTDVEADTPERLDFADRADHPVSGRGAQGDGIDVERVLPWRGTRTEEDLAELRVAGFYYAYLRDRPDSVLAALRVLAHEDGAAIVHCAAGKDRTGVLSALALEVAGVTREAIIADYVATGDRLEQILARLRSSDTYRADLDSRPADSHRPRAEYIEHFLGALDDRFGGPLGWLDAHGWTSADAQALRARLRA